MAYRVLTALTLFGLGLALAARPGEAAAEWNFGARIGMPHRASERSPVASLEVTDPLQRHRQQRNVAPYDRGIERIGLNDSGTGH